MDILEREKATILIIDDSPVNVRLLTRALEDNYKVIVTQHCLEALEQAFTHAPDLIFLDIETPEMSGYEVFAKLKGDPRTKETPIIIITAMRDGLYEKTCLELGAIDFIKKPFNPRLVKLRVRNHIELKMLRDYYKGISCIDELTGLPNRRRLKGFINDEWDRLSRSNSPLSVIMLDIDHFKQYNDTYGHLVGDECLQQIAEALQKANTRSKGLLARYGGEEFIVVLPDTDCDGARAVGQNCVTSLLH